VSAAVVERLQDRQGRLLVVANLPYAIVGPLLAGLCCLPDLPDVMVLLVQWELGQRIAAKPGGRDYGALSVLAQLHYSATVCRRVGRQVFRPRPAVDSAGRRQPTARRRGLNPT